MDELYNKLNESFEQIYSALKRDLSRIRTGRANINILDGVRVGVLKSPQNNVEFVLLLIL